MYRGNPIWVVTANASRARIWTAEKPAAPLRPVREMDAPEARMHERELTTDLPGRAFDSKGQGRHVMEQEVGPKQAAARRFAKDLAQTLAAEARRQAFDKLYLIAAPSFLGLLREELREEARAALNGAEVVEVDKDYTALEAAGLRERLPEYL